MAGALSQTPGLEGLRHSDSHGASVLMEGGDDLRKGHCDGMWKEGVLGCGEGYTEGKKRGPWKGFLRRA